MPPVNMPRLISCATCLLILPVFPAAGRAATSTRPRRGAHPVHSRQTVRQKRAPRALVSTLPTACPPALDECNVVFTTPSANASGAVPIGNGEVGASVWIEPNGDLVFYLSRPDSFSEASRLLKLGKVRVSLTPSPLIPGAPFHQELKLRQGRLEADMGDTHLEIFAQPDSPVFRVSFRSRTPRTARVTYEGWRTERRVLKGGELGSSWTMSGAPMPVAESADVVVNKAAAPDAPAWYHHNSDSVVLLTLKLQSCEGLPGAEDPYLNRTFGAWIEGAGLVRDGDTALVSKAPVTAQDLRIACPLLVTPDTTRWIALAHQTARAASPLGKARTAAEAWWRAFWNRSWILVSGAAASGTSVPSNNYPLRIGIDSGGGNLFGGSFGRIGIYNRALSPAEITLLAGANQQTPAPVTTGRVFSAMAPKPWTILPEQASLQFKNGYTLEAWIHPDTLEGRILDKVTAGVDDGILFDLQGSTLRLIAGSIHLTANGVIHPGVWQHVVAVGYPDGVTVLYLNGKEVARDGTAAARNAISSGYNLQRYVFACEGRTDFPIKFNGGIFTVEPVFESGEKYNPDYRRWGDCFWWQNTRHMYHPMLEAGDTDLMSSLFRYYERWRPLAESRVKSWFGASGCYFPETMTPFGTYANGDYGWNRANSKPNQVQSPWWRYAWNQGPELVALMLDYYDWTGDQQFLKTQLLPMARSVLAYFDTRFHKDAKGLIVLDPCQVIETYRDGVINDMPTVAGIRTITDRLTALPTKLVAPADRAFFARMQKACPAIPTEMRKLKDGTMARSLAPAQRYDPHTSNSENPELYAVWPYRLYAVGKPGLAMARTAYATRKFHLDRGWGYDGNVAALLGLTDEAGRILQIHCQNSHAGYRFPATWGPNYDWLPDQNHGGNLMEMAQLMLLQPDGDKIRLLAAWPPAWNVNFRLHAPHNTIVEGTVSGGKLARLQVTPAARRADIIVSAPFKLP